MPRVPVPFVVRSAHLWAPFVSVGVVRTVLVLSPGLLVGVVVPAVDSGRVIAGFRRAGIIGAASLEA
jgi:hypothetical protein